MKMMNKLLALLTALMLCVLPAMAETTAEDVLATVNGAAVTRAEYEACLAQLQNAYSSYGYDVTDETIAAVLQQFAMETAVEYELLDAVILENGLQLTDEELADTAQAAREDWQYQIDEIIAEYESYGMVDPADEASYAAVLLQILSTLESVGYTEESYIAEAQKYAAYDKAYEWIVSDVTVTEDEVRARYDELVDADRIAYANDVTAYESLLEYNEMYLMLGMTDYYVELYYTPEGYRNVIHILLEADEAALAAYTAAQENPEATADEIEAARLAVLASVQPTIDEINQKLAEGVSFAELIPLYTADPGMADAASIAAGYEVHAQSTKWVIPFRDAAFTVENPGDVTAPVVTDFGVHILQYVADIPGGAKPYTDDVRALLTEELLLSRQSTRYTEVMQGMLTEAEIVYAAEAQAFIGGN